MIELLTPSQAKILEHLARYKFLTSSQLIRLGVSNRRSNLSVMLKPLKESKRALVGEMQFAFVPSKGRLENFYYLKPKGKEVLINAGILDERNIKIPKGRSILFTQDYFHRKYTIDCHISCDLSAQKKVLNIKFFDRYFDKVGNNRKNGNLQARTKVDLFNDYIIADGAFLLDNGTNSRLYAFELYNDNNAKRILGQIQKHIEGIKHSSLCRNYNIEKGHRLLSVFTQSNTKELVMSKIKDSPFSRYLLFNQYETVVNDFFCDWQNLSRDTIQIDK